MCIRDFMSFYAQNLGHIEMKCSNFSIMTSRFGLICPRLAGFCSERKYREKKYINLNAFIDVCSFNEGHCNAMNFLEMNERCVLQNGDLSSSCLLMNLLQMNGL